MAGSDANIRTRDLNQATLRDIANIPFMNEQRARLIIAYRESVGEFKTIDEVDEVTGIGDKLSKLIKQHFHVGGEGQDRGQYGNEPAQPGGEEGNDNQQGGAGRRAASGGRGR